MKRIYLSGPITGLPEFNFPAFHAAAARLRQSGYEVANPAEINTETDGDWHEYLKADIKALCDCDALALLPGWQNSTGAHLELHIAHRLGIEIGTLEEFANPTYTEYDLQWSQEEIQKFKESDEPPLEFNRIKHSHE